MAQQSKIRLTRVQGRGVIEILPSDIIGQRPADIGGGTVLTIRPGVLPEGWIGELDITVSESPAEIDGQIHDARSY